MKKSTADWIEKAEGDFDSLERECRARRRPNYDSACFHAQQCCEKYLKGRLCEAGKPISKTHDLVALLESVLAVEPVWEVFREDLARLTDFAVLYRYPGESADKSDAHDARLLCRRFRDLARVALRLSTGNERRPRRN